MISSVCRHFFSRTRSKRFSVRKRLLVWGDSNSSLPNKRSCWPSVLERKSSCRYRVFNDSVSGRTTGYDKKKLNSSLDFKRRFKKYTDIGLVLVMLGTNDVKIGYGPPLATEIASNLNYIVNSVFATRKNIRLAFLLPPPIGSDLTGDFFKADERILQVCKEIHKFCVKRGISVIDTHSILNINDDLETDAIHLNSKGRHIVSDAVLNFLYTASQ